MATPESLQEPIIVKTYLPGVDEYGQQHTEFTTRDATMCCFKYVQTPNDGIMYNNIRLVGLSHAKLTDEDSVIYRDVEYKVQYFIYTHRWNVYYLSLYEH